MAVCYKKDASSFYTTNEEYFYCEQAAQRVKNRRRVLGKRASGGKDELFTTEKPKRKSHSLSGVSGATGNFARKFSQGYRKL